MKHADGCGCRERYCSGYANGCGCRVCEARDVRGLARLQRVQRARVLRGDVSALAPFRADVGLVTRAKS